MSLRLTALQQQVQKEIEGLEREIRNMQEQLVTKGEEADTLRRALRALGGIGKEPEREPEQDQRRAPGGEAATARKFRERTLLREGITRHLKEQPELTAAQLAALIEAEWGEGPLTPIRIVRMVSFMPQVIGDFDSGYVYVPAEGEEDGGMGNESE